jgi:prepilin signal peptidase PulO-like enzyme (type II secretory pathway)
MEILLTSIAVVFGLIVGSFVNVVILRLPEGKDIALARSACRTCSRQLSWYENIPVVSYIFLRGKCRTCESRISLQYPTVEILHGLFAYLTLADWYNYSSLELLSGFSQFILTAILIAHFWIDLKHQLLMDKLNIALLVPVVTLIVVHDRYIDALAGGAFGFLVPLAVTWLFYKISGKIGLGGGDIKLFGIVGLMFGIQGVMLNLFTSCLVGSVLTLILIASKQVRRDQYIPFGPYIILVIFSQLYLPDVIDQWRTFLFPY